MKTGKKRVFQGTGERTYKPLPGAFNEPEPYRASKELVEAVNMALHLRRPLLLEGDPGCGKTRLAFAVAYELGYPLHTIYIRSDSKAQDLLYTFDAVRRLYDIQERTASSLGTTKGKPVDKENEQEDKRKYVTRGKLGEAIALSEKDHPSVVLIDEIDKADIDFPNDLLQVLDRMEYEVPEVDEKPPWRFDALKGKSRAERRDFLPLVIVTSNREKELPAAFLRRCLFYYIDFPSEEELKEITGRHIELKPPALFEQALKRFWQLRFQTEFTWLKPPSTSELLDWVSLLGRDHAAGKLTAKKLDQAKLGALPHLEALVKKLSDLEALKRLR